MNTITPDIRDRARGALLGVHAGDSLGATVEFQSASSVASRFPDGLRDIIGGGPFNWDAGDPTDDTDLTWAICQGYLDANFDPDQSLDAAAKRMAAWYLSGPPDIGTTTVQGLGQVARGGDPRTSGNASERSQANGGLMRTMGVAVARLFNTDLRADDAIAMSAVTHASDVCVESCVAYCDIAAALIVGVDPATAITDTTINQPDGPVRDALNEAVTVAKNGGRLTDLTGPMGGWVLWALKCAVYETLTANTFEDGVVEVIMLGDDSDTVGAITGGLLGARFGAVAIPQRWTDMLKLGPALTDFADTALESQ